MDGRNKNVVLPSIHIIGADESDRDSNYGSRTELTSTTDIAARALGRVFNKVLSFNGSTPLKYIRKMYELTNYVSDTHSFYEKTDEERQNENKNERPNKNVPPVFNKRLFVTSGNVVITKEARRIMARNARYRPEEDPVLSKTDLRTMKSVVEGLKLIHKDQGHIKDALSHCVTMETYDAFQYVVKKQWEDVLSCYYIVHGAAEVTYDMRATSSRTVYQPNIIYSHGTGEYLGIVSSEDRTEDIAPPATVYTKEFCEFLRIDRDKFHRICERFKSILLMEIRRYVFGKSAILAKVSREVREKILPLIQKEEYSPNKTILHQDEVSEYLYFIISGRCQLCREVYIPEAQKTVTFYVACKEPDEMFGVEGVLDNDPSFNSVITTSPTIVYRVPRIAFDIVNKESLSKIIAKHRDEEVEDADLMDRGYFNSMWKNYKHSKVSEALKENGKMKYMCKDGPSHVAERPPSALEQHKENMYRFIQKGAEYEPYRVRSAIQRPKSGHKLPNRPQTVANVNVTDNGADEEESCSSDEETEQSQLITKDLAKTLDSFYAKLQGNEEDMLKALDENSELGKHLRKAWETPGTDQKDKDGFMENGVLATMESDDIVRKAMAMADKKATRQKKRSSIEEEEWNTVLHAENKNAKFMAAANNMRVKMLRKKMEDLHKRRVIMFEKPTKPSKDGEVIDHNNNSRKKRFMLDKLSDMGTRSKEEKDTETAVAIRGTMFITKTKRKVYQSRTQDDSDVISQERKDEDEEFLEKHLSRLRPSSAIVTKEEQTTFKSTHKKGPSRRTLGISTSSISSWTSSSSGYKSSQTSLRSS
ncbi:unnamed protein product [Mytilus edulis]|uniref:Cyclic nucleotide-binding domain-containing protein n=1 Tax=Mytilus edulis TaxID=6550 RepID=A0A8S3V2Z8_MYTED|nr:unnamed protein product [Mytilus edulis]